MNKLVKFIVLYLCTLILIVSSFLLLSGCIDNADVSSIGNEVSSEGRPVGQSGDVRSSQSDIGMSTVGSSAESTLYSSAIGGSSHSVLSSNNLSHSVAESSVSSSIEQGSSSEVLSSATLIDYPVLEPSSDRLDNITKQCSSMPSKISGGQSGWNSRYWDCCKPHCSWKENTENVSKNCSIDDEEIACYRDVSNEWWTGYEGTQSGCEADGEAFTCYSHAPFAVCEDLAYGFAAVPAEGSVCGRCFQLDYDGGFKHGEPKATHKLMAGKTMIVMASNIGHDVSGGQFDIMIPGGGVGAFPAGCGAQWDVDVNDENLVGKKFGGFTSTCQEKLGWDEPVESYKECVRDMCDTLFGDDPNKRDLWEGCIWYVDWMHAVDNPTFTYTEVECPQELLEAYGSNMH